MTLKISLLSGALLLAPLLADASVFFKVTGRVERTTDGVTYYYTITNNSWTNVTRPAVTSRIEIGRDPSRDEPELTGLPPTPDPTSGMLMYPGNGVLAMTAPAGWVGDQSGTEGYPGHTLTWETANGGTGTGDRGLLPGQSMTVSVTRAEANPSYLGVPHSRPEGYARTHYVISTNDGVQAYGMVELDASADTIPPMLSVTLSPSTIAASPPGRVYIVAPTFAVSVAITATDNADSAPAIRLESMTLNGAPYTAKLYSLSGRQPDPAQVAVFGTDDRAFRLLLPSSAAVYTVTYSATDVTGNKTLATGTIKVTAPQTAK